MQPRAISSGLQSSCRRSPRYSPLVHRGRSCSRPYDATRALARQHEAHCGQGRSKLVRTMCAVQAPVDPPPLSRDPQCDGCRLSCDLLCAAIGIGVAEIGSATPIPIDPALCHALCAFLESHAVFTISAPGRTMLVSAGLPSWGLAQPLGDAPRSGPICRPAYVRRFGHAPCRSHEGASVRAPAGSPDPTALVGT
jgi:hypothetical protein